MSYKLKLLFVNVFFLGCLTSFCSCEKSQNQVPEPKIKAGIAKIRGKFDDPLSKGKQLMLSYRNPITAKLGNIKTKIESDGSFYFEALIECDPCMGTFISSSHARGLPIMLTSDKEMFFELKSDSRGNLICVDNVEIFDEGFKIAYDKFINYMYDYKPLCEMTPEEYAEYEMKMLKIRSDNALKGITISDDKRDFLLNEWKLQYLCSYLFGYKKRLEGFCKLNKIKDENWSAQEPNLSYYKFLKEFDLNNPQYFHNLFFASTIQSLLSVETFNIPPISDTPVKEWLTIVKSSLSDLIGFESGQFYDILVAHAYSKQFIDLSNSAFIADVIKPLSDKQITNIKEYFGDGEIAKILLRKNKEILKIYEEGKSK